MTSTLLNFTARVFLHDPRISEEESNMKRFDTAPLQEYSAEEIKGIRNRLNMTQAVFALFMGVSKKTVEAWESGQNIPNGPSLRLLWMAEQDPGFPERYGIVKVERHD